jgi:glycosyltransferase involved in cell wall biosynthesis
MFHANLLTRVSRLLWRSVPLINSSHVSEAGVPWQHRIYRLTMNLCELFHCVSEESLQHLVGSRCVPVSKSLVIPNGIQAPSPAAGTEGREEIRTELGLQDAFIFLNVGRLHPAKDQSTLLEAFGSLAETGRVGLVIVGSGPLEGSLRQQASTIGSEVRFTGARDDVEALMRAADAFVLSSRTEALPVSLLEAAAAALPVIATSVGEVPRLIQDGVSGLLCEPENPGSLRRGMQQMIRLTPEQRGNMAAELWTRVRDTHAIESVTDRWEEAYRLVLG